MSNDHSRSQCNVKNEYDPARFFMLEYPSHLLNEWNDKKTIQYLNSDTLKHFVKSRINSIKTATILYYVLLFLLLVQLSCFMVSAFLRPEPDETMRSDIIALCVLKAAGLGLWIGSMNAWRKQFWEDKEFYALALANYSKDEPIDRTLKNGFGIENAPSRVVIGDWLRNRPSIVFWLIVAISFLYSWRTPYIFDWEPLQRIGVLLGKLDIQIIIATLMYIFSLPLVVDFKFNKICKDAKNCDSEEGKTDIGEVSKKETFDTRKPPLSDKGFYVFTMLIWILLFVSPLLVARYADTVLIACIILVVIAGLIYGILYFLSKKRVNDQIEADSDNIKSIKRLVKPNTGDSSTSTDNPDTPPALSSDAKIKGAGLFSKLSCKGQIQLLSMIQNGDLSIEYISDLESKAHTPQILDLILEIERSHQMISSELQTTPRRSDTTAGKKKAANRKKKKH